MTDLTLKFKFTDRGGNAVYDVDRMNLDPKGPHQHLGQIRIPPDPRIAELDEALSLAVNNKIAAENKVSPLNTQIADLKSKVAELEAENKILRDKLEGMMLAYQICKDPALGEKEDE